MEKISPMALQVFSFAQAHTLILSWLNLGQLIFSWAPILARWETTSLRLDEKKCVDVKLMMLLHG